ncbi:uncharacterized protein LOC132749973 [Ruditapes philippinarum]|uniref:uncharacterized protein LOC132749973 n=1 Tax=Ruditapes philippinarum TaxID=129788 RepID=UPI00295B260F|nr:uncharacterized protein LOC132749973 [Ruditapes philippinarum]
MDTLFLRGVSVPAVSAAIPLESRHTRDVNPPCFLNDDNIQPEVNSTLASSFEKIKDQVQDLKAKIELQITRMQTSYCIERNSDALMSAIHMFSLSDNEAFVHEFTINQPSFLEKITGHYDMLDNLAYTLEELSETAADDHAKQNLLQIQARTYNAMCTIKTLLRSQNKHLTNEVPSGRNSFQIDGICDQHQMEYITMLNGYLLAEYLDLMYTTVLNHQN